MNLIDKHDGASTVLAEPVAGCIDHLAHVFDPRRHRRESHKLTTGDGGDHFGNGGFAGAWRAPQDDRAQPV